MKDRKNFKKNVRGVTCKHWTYVSEGAYCQAVDSVAKKLNCLNCVKYERKERGREHG